MSIRILKNYLVSTIACIWKDSKLIPGLKLYFLGHNKWPLLKKHSESLCSEHKLRFVYRQKASFQQVFNSKDDGVCAVEVLTAVSDLKKRWFERMQICLFIQVADKQI